MRGGSLSQVIAAFGYDRLVFEANWFFCNFVSERVILSASSDSTSSEYE